MPSPFVYRSLQSIRPGFSVGTLRNVNSLSVFVSGIVFIAPAFSKVRYRGSTFRPFVRSFVRPSVRPQFASSLGINFVSLQQW